MSERRNRIVAGVLWFLALVIFFWQAKARGNATPDVLLGCLVFGVFLFAMLGFADEAFRAFLTKYARRGMLWLFLFPVAAWLLASAYAVGWARTGIPWGLLLYAVIPVGLASLAIRAGERPNLLDLLAVLAIWFPVELGVLPGAPLPASHGVVGVDKLFAIPTALYAFLIVRRLAGVGFRFDCSGSDLKWSLLYFLAFMPFALGLGLPTSFIRPSEHAPDLARIVATLVAIFLFTGIPEEVLFRGLIQNMLAQRLREKGRWKPVSLAITSVIFGWAHVNNHVPPLAHWDFGPLGVLTVPWVYVVLATIAGVFYGLTYLRTGKVTAAALVHALVDATWSLAFSG